MEAHGHANSTWIHAGGWVGIVTAGVAWYTSAALVINGQAGRQVVPLGEALWKDNRRTHMTSHRQIPA
jgi:succinate-acetate transporter protein